MGRGNVGSINGLHRGINKGMPATSRGQRHNIFVENTDFDLKIKGNYCT